MKKNKGKQKRKALRSGKVFSRYQVITSLKRYNLGAFPLSEDGLSQAKAWAEKMTGEMGESCVIEKR